MDLAEVPAASGCIVAPRIICWGAYGCYYFFFFAQKRMLVKGAPFGCMLLTAQKRMLVKGAPFGCMLLLLHATTTTTTTCY